MGEVVGFRKIKGYLSEDERDYIMKVEYSVLLKKGTDELLRELAKKILPPDINTLVGDLYEVLSLYRHCNGKLSEGNLCRFRGLITFQKTKSGWAVREEDSVLFY